MSQVAEVLQPAGAARNAWVKGMLCFVGADWSWLAKPFVFQDIAVAWPLAALEILSRPGDGQPLKVPAVASLLARMFPQPDRPSVDSLV